MISSTLPYFRFFFLIGVCIVGLPTNAAFAQQSAAPVIVKAQVGFEGAYKLGCWAPLTVEIQCGSQAWAGQMVVTHPDTDGVPTRVLTDVQVEAEQTVFMRQFVRVGQVGSPIHVALVSNEGETQASRDFYLGSYLHNGVPSACPATNRMVLEFGPTLNLSELVQTDGRVDEQVTTRIARVEAAKDLPTRWYGYESVEAVLLSTSQPALYDLLAQDQERVRALEAWVERGGRLVVFCASAAEELFSEGGALAPLAPGKFKKMERLTNPQPLAAFSGSEQPITRDRRLSLDVPSFTDVRGQILASAGRSATNVPLVVRTQRGFGEIVFVGLDFDRAPLSSWAGRTRFIGRLLNWQDRDSNQQTIQQQEVEDLSGHLRNSLDKQFVGVQVAPFGLVALLVGVYVLLIGPGDYLFVKRILGRTEITWLTFPLIVAGVSAAAYGIANYMKGDQLCVNQVEIIDVDCTDESANNHFARGTVWTHFFTPEVSELNLRLQPSLLGKTELEQSEQLVSWLGLPGYALGGMQASGSQTSVFDAGYQYGGGFSTLERLPVQNWSTKTLSARWSARVETPFKTELQQDGEELLVGQVSNDTNVELEDCLLLYGRWAYNLGRMPISKRIEINDSIQPRTVKTLLTNATAGDDTVTRTAEDGAVPFASAQWDVARLIKAMMFYQAVNGPRYTSKVHNYQPFADLSALLHQDDQAILLAKCKEPGTQWITSNHGSMEEKPLASDDLTNADRRWTYYRFILPVNRREQ